MTTEVLIVLAVTLGAILMFVTEWLRVDVTALLVLLSLTLLGIISYERALGGFSNEAVITIASVLVLSGGLTRTGVANIVGRRILSLAGGTESQLLFVMMLTVGLMSGIMNNIAVTALMLPVVVDIARRTRRAPSRLLMPLAFGSLLGGMSTLIGTSPNILIAGALADHGLDPFTLFDFTPVGLTALAVGTIYMVVIGRRLLPERDMAHQTTRGGPEELERAYQLPQILFTLQLPPDSELAGKSLADIRVRPALGLNVMAIVRDGTTHLAPGPDAVLRAGDKLVVEGTVERLETLRGWAHLEIDEDWQMPHGFAAGIRFVEIAIPEESRLIGRTVGEIDFRGRTGVEVLGIAHDGESHLTHLRRMVLQAGDRLLMVGKPKAVEKLPGSDGITLVRSLKPREVGERWGVQRRLMSIRLPEVSMLVGNSIVESRLRDALGLSVLAIVRDRGTLHLPHPDTVFEAGDQLIVEGRHGEFENLYAMQALEIDEQSHPTIEDLQTEEVGLAEVLLAPRTRLEGKTLREIHFHEKFDLTVVAVWRESQVLTAHLRSLPLKFGDALLVYGALDKLTVLAKEHDFLVLTEAAREAYREERAPLAAAIMGGVIVTVATGLAPISIAALAGATLMVIAGCLSATEAYHSVEWKVVVLIAGMLSLGVAMETSGTVEIAHRALGAMATYGPYGLIAGLFIITALSAQIMPTAAVAVLMSQIVLSSAGDLGLSPYALLMVVAIGSSSAFMSPVGHPLNLLVMGVGGYRFIDYTRVGAGLTLLLLLVVLLVLPIFWPLSG